MAFDNLTQSRPVISKTAHEKLRELSKQQRRTLQATLELLIEKAHRENVQYPKGSK